MPSTKGPLVKVVLILAIRAASDKAHQTKFLLETHRKFAGNSLKLDATCWSFSFVGKLSFVLRRLFTTDAGERERAALMPVVHHTTDGITECLIFYKAVSL